MFVSFVRLSLAMFAALAAFGPDRIARAEDGSACDTVGIVAKALPATVNITVVKVLKGDEPDDPQTGPEHLDVAQGSGIIVDPSGIIVTNKHVIKGGAHMWVTFSDHSQVDAQLIGAANLIDVAVLKVNVPGRLSVLKFANSDAARIGQPVIAIGNPLGLGTSISTGIISAVNRDLMRSPFDDYIQTDAAINPGNSGGALLNCAGDVIGINTALVSNNKLLGSIGLGFALPANDVAYVVPRLFGSDYTPNWVGLHMQDLTATLANSFGRPNMFGAVVTGVDPDSPAAQVGIAAGDTISAINDHKMADARGILRHIISMERGEPIVLTVSRGGDTKNVTVAGLAWPHMMELRSDVLASADSVSRAQAKGIGLHVVPISPADRKRIAADPNHLGVLPDGTGVTIDRVTPGSQADTLDLKVGDIIAEVNDRLVKVPSDVPTAYGHDDPKTGKMVAMLIRGAERVKWVSVFIGHVDVTALLTPPPAAQMQAHSPVHTPSTPSNAPAAPNAASQVSSTAAPNGTTQNNPPAAHDAAATGQR